MAKLGTECRLVLKLAKERSKAQIGKTGTTEYAKGVIQGHKQYEQILNEIALEIERGK